MIFLSNRQKEREGGGVQRPPPQGLMGLNINILVAGTVSHGTETQRHGAVVEIEPGSLPSRALLPRHREISCTVFNPNYKGKSI